MIGVIFRVICIIISAKIQHIETNNTDRLSVNISPKLGSSSRPRSSFFRQRSGGMVRGLLESVSSAGV